MNQKGFSQVILLGIIAILILAGVGGVLVFREKKLPSLDTSSENLEQKLPVSLPTKETALKIKKPSLIHSDECTGKGPVIFSSSPKRLTDIEFIEPLGKLNASSGHITPTDHGYYIPPNWKPQDKDNPAEFKEVMAPADGIVTTVQLVNNVPRDYRLIIHHTCTFYTIYIHVKELSPRIATAVGQFTSMTKKTKIPVKVGEVIGKANALDFSVHDDDVTLKGFIVPEHYFPETWKIHTVDMFAYFAEPIKSQLLEKNIRTAEPRTGKIDYDIDGKLVGNWFVENTNGYEGLESNRNRGHYWATHLSFAPHYIDPTLIIISIGDFDGSSKEFGVKGNSPDPATVGVSTGMVKYELTGYEFVDQAGRYWDRLSYVKNLRAVGGDNIQGVVLAQLIDTRKLKFEVFPGKTAAEVSGFTKRAKIYER